MSVFDLSDFDDEPTEEELAELHEFLDEIGELTPDDIVTIGRQNGLSEQEVQIDRFLFVHEQEEIVAAQGECLGYLWTGRRLH